MNKSVSLAIFMAVGAALAPTNAWSAATLIAGWDFETVEADGTSIKSVVGTAIGRIVNSAIVTDSTGGRPLGGGKGFDVSQANPGWLQVADEDGANATLTQVTDDAMTVVLWEKNTSNINSSSFWSRSDINDRWFQFHVPWSDGTIYFDTAGGCCAAPGQRLALGVVGALPDFDWLAWHHYAFVKDVGAKRIYIDGVLFHSQDEGADPLIVDGATEWRFTVGGADQSAPVDAVIDDFAIFKGALTEAEIKALAAGGSPFKPPTDTDSDGMPDDWEILYGLKPTDASDATLDPDNDGANNLAEYKAGTNPVDTIKPTLVSAVSTASFDTVTLTFSEVVDPTVAAVTSHYSISPTLAITAAVPKKNTVVLTTAKQTPGATAYTVTVNGVLDTSKNAVPTDSKAIFYSYVNLTDGVLKFSFWGNTSGSAAPAPPAIGGNAVADLVADPRYPASPDLVAAATSFNSRTVFPSDIHEAYGATMEGILTPTEDGDYDFFLRTDDGGELHISTDATEAGLVLQAEEVGCCGAFLEPGDPRTTAAPLTLKAGSKYYIRGIYKEGGGGDYLQVAWRKTTDATPAGALQPIPGRFFTAPGTGAPLPAEGVFQSISPAPNDKNAFPGLVQVVHIDGKTVWDNTNVSLDVDGTMVQATITKSVSTLTVTYVPNPIFAGKSVHNATLHYRDPGNNPATLNWTFTTFAYSGPTKDTVKSYPGLIRPNAVYTADKGGHTGAAGDFGMDLTARGGPIYVLNTDFLFEVNKATAADELSATFWAKHHAIPDSSALNFNSPSSGSQRAFHAHVPWSDGHIYFDTVGCCDGATQRIESGIDLLPGFDGTAANDVAWWTNKWHHYAFTKKGSTKRIWVDGKLLLEGDNTAKLPTDVNLLYIGSEQNGAGALRAVIDDFATYSKELVEADVVALFGGTLPNALPAAKGLIAYWPFNDVSGPGPGDPPPLTFVKGVDKVTLSWTGTTFKLLKADKVNGPYTEVAAATSPRDVSTLPPAAEAYYKLSN